jgi:two-component system OmpR family response regulator
VSEEDVDLVFLDLNLGSTSGLDVLRQMREIDPSVLVIIITGYGTVESAVEAIKMGAYDYIKKPFNHDEFREVIDRVMKRKGLARSPEEELHKVIGSTIRALRKERTLTLKQMARRTSLSVSLLSQIERAESSASISSLYKIALALDTRITRLFGDF